jgi:hypothetical protein
MVATQESKHGRPAPDGPASLAHPWKPLMPQSSRAVPTKKYASARGYAPLGARYRLSARKCSVFVASSKFVDVNTGRLRRRLWGQRPTAGSRAATGLVAGSEAPGRLCTSSVQSACHL